MKASAQAPILGVEAAVDDEGRQVRGDEGDVEAADEEAGGEKQIASMPERLGERLAEALLAHRSAVAPSAVRRAPSRARESRASSTPRIVSACAQPKVWISAWPSGAKTNCPIEPAAVPMPKTIERLSAGTRRPKAASTIEKERGRHAEPHHQAGA